LICIFPGNQAFGQSLLAALRDEPLDLEWRRFPDGESYLRFAGSCAGRAVALVCTLHDPDPKALALLFAARTLRELGAESVGLVAPYLGYMRQDRRFKDGEAITSVHFAAFLSDAFDWLVTVDPHLHRRASLAEIYSIPASLVAAAPAIGRWIAQNVAQPLVIGPDSESEQWAAEVAEGCGAPHAVMSKTRHGDRDVEIQPPSLERWKGYQPVLLDDIISSAHTMALAASRIQEAGLLPPVCVAVHGIFSTDALATLRHAGVTKVVTTNTIAHATNGIDVADLVGAAVQATSEKGAHASGA
jgi:ribose-phosphate pyrophosphokinase